MKETRKTVREPKQALTFAPEPAWMKQAACRRFPAEWWYLEPGREADNEKALRICRTSCPVLRDCLAYAVSLVGEKGGPNNRPLGVIWAGIKWQISKTKVERVPRFRPCICCGGEVPPWMRSNQARCEQCVKQGVRA